MVYGLDQSASIYTAGSDGDFTVLAKSGLACRLAYVRHDAADVGEEREDIGSRRRLLWEEAYEMPDPARVVVDSENWNVLSGTYGELRGPSGAVVYRRCEVERAL